MLMLPPVKYKTSQFGSLENVKKINACSHVWEFITGTRLLTANWCWWRCGKCGTFKR